MTWQKLASYEDRRRRAALLPQDLLDGFAFGQLVDELVQIADRLHGRFFDVFHPHAANHAFDERPRRIELWRLSKEGFEVRFL